MTSDERKDRVFLVRHGETEWSKSGRHTSVTDLPLTADGERVAASLRDRLAAESFDLVLTSPRQRARRTAELAGFPGAEVDDDLVEWNYGDYEGLTSEQIQVHAPGWLIFRNGCPGGESPVEIGARVDRVIARVRAIDGEVALFAHGHFFRVFAARWLGMPVEAGAHFLLDTATLSILGYYQGIPAVKRWNAPLTASDSSAGLARKP